MKPSAAQKHLFYTELAKLLEAGFGIRQAIAAILDTKPPAAQTAMLEKMDEGLAVGNSIAVAFGNSGAGVTDLEKTIVGAGERGGRLGQAFQHLADYFSLLASARRDAVQSMLYPFVLLHLGLLVSIVPGALMADRSAGSILVSIGISLIILYLGLALIAFLVRMVLKAAPVNAALDGFLNRIPILGNARRNMAMARFTKVYHTAVLAGLSMNETVAAASAASNSGIIRQAGGRLLARTQESDLLGPEFIASGAFPSAFARSYATAEEAGGLDKDLERWSRVFQDDAARGAKALSVAVPKLFYFLVVIFVVWKILGFYNGYFEQLDQLGP